MPKRSTRGKSKNIFARLIEKIFFLAYLLWKSIPTLLIAAVFYFSFFSVKDLLSADAYFQVATLKIFPRGILSDQEYQALEQRATGLNILKADLRKIRAMIEMNPKVKQADVIRKLPNELEILLTPRKPAMQLKGALRGLFYTLGEDGVVMSSSETRDLSLIELTHLDYSTRNLKPLDRYSDPAWYKLEGILEFLRKNDATKREKIDRIQVDKMGNFTISFIGGLDIVLRDTSDLTTQKMIALGNLLASEERNLIAYIDLRHIDLILKYK